MKRAERPLSLPKARFVRTGDAIRPRLHVRQCLRSASKADTDQHGVRLLTRPAKKIFPCPFDRFDKISLRERALTNV